MKRIYPLVGKYEWKEFLLNDLEAFIHSSFDAKPSHLLRKKIFKHFLKRDLDKALTNWFSISKKLTLYPPPLILRTLFVIRSLFSLILPCIYFLSVTFKEIYFSKNIKIFFYLLCDCENPAFIMEKKSNQNCNHLRHKSLAPFPKIKKYFLYYHSSPLSFFWCLTKKKKSSMDVWWSKWICWLIVSPFLFVFQGQVRLSLDLKAF